MPSLNLFRDDAFGLASLTAALQRLPYRPSRIAELAIFEPKPVNTLDVYVEYDNQLLSLVPISRRGAPGTPISTGRREARPFRVSHVKMPDTVLADEVMGVRTFGSESELETLVKVVGARLAGLRNSLEYTLESHMMACILGTYFDPYGNPKSLFSEFGLTQETVGFALDDDTTQVRSKCLEVLEKTEDALGGVGFTGIKVLCGRGFWQKLIENKTIKETYLNTMMAASLREDPRQAVDFGGLSFERYRGTADVKVPDNEAVAFPVGVSGLFFQAFAPADWVETVGTMGQRMYAKQWEMEAGRGIMIEAQSSPFTFCSRPGALVRLTTP